jgi:hypothetical protein
MSQIQPVTPADVSDLPPHLQTMGADLDFTDPTSPLAPYYLQTSDVVAAGFLAALFVFFNFLPLWHTDVWGHLRNGQWIVENHRLPDRDVLCRFSDPDANSLHVYWLSQTGFFLVYHTGEWLAGGDSIQRMGGGVTMLRALHALLVMARFLLLLLALRRLGCPPAMACCALFFLLVLSIGYIMVLRPQVLGELFLTAMLLALSRKVLSRRALVLLPLVLVLWANSHASFVLGLAVVGGCLVGEIGRALLAQRSLQPRCLLADVQIRRLFFALSTSIVAVAIFNPHGPFIYPITFQMSRNLNVNLMDEWQPISFLHPEAVTYIYLATLVLVLVTQILSRNWFSPVQLVLLIGLGVPPLFHRRMMVWWLLSLPWLIIPQLTSARERLPHYWQPPPPVSSFRKTILAGLIVVALAVWSAPGQWLVTGKTVPLAQSVSEGTPWQLAHELTQPGAVTEEWQQTLASGLRAYPHHEYHGVVFASETLGDYFAFILPQRTMPVFIDTHVHLFKPEQWQRTVLVKWAQPGWRELLDNWIVDLVVVEADLYLNLREALKRDADWLVVLDETGSPKKLNSNCRLFVALRKTPRLN